MAQCKFCRKRFASAQGVRSHLKFCAPYRENVPRERVPIKGLPREPKAGGIAEPVLDELQAERAKLDLRKVRGEHRRLDAEEAERRRQEREAQEAAGRQAESLALARQEAKEQARRQTRRRELIQDAKKRVETPWVRGRTLPSTVKTQALRAVEEELAGLTRLEELPEQEIRELAQGAWDGVVLPWVQALEAQEERERRRQREAEEAKQRLLARGKRYAEGRLDAEGIEGLERLVILPKVEATLTRELTGAETGRDVEALVEEVLAPEIQRVRREAEAEAARRATMEEERKRREAEQARALQELARERRERERERQERAEEARLAANRQRLARHGESYALRVMNDENELKPLERFQVAREVKEQLLEELDGDESEEEVEALVNRVLDAELGE